VNLTDRNILQAGNRGFGLLFDGVGYLEVKPFPTRLINEFSIYMKMQYRAVWPAKANAFSGGILNKGMPWAENAYYALGNTPETTRTDRIFDRYEQILVEKSLMYRQQ